MKTENLKKLAEVIIDEANGYTPSIEDYYKALDFEDAEKLDDFFQELDEHLFDDEWIVLPSAEWLDIWAGEFREVKAKHQPVEFHYENGKQIVEKYEEDRWTPFIEEHKDHIESIVAWYSYNSEKFNHNLLTIFKDYIDMKKVAKEVWCDACDSQTEEEVYEQLMNGEPIY